MAQTKRKRRTKHRGTAAGTIQSRGRTGRPPTPDERKKQARVSAREKRMNTPPTWKSSATRASFAAVIMFIFLVITTKGSNRIVAALVFAARKSTRRAIHDAAGIDRRESRRARL